MHPSNHKQYWKRITESWNDNFKPHIQTRPEQLVWILWRLNIFSSPLKQCKSSHRSWSYAQIWNEMLKKRGRRKADKVSHLDKCMNAQISVFFDTAKYRISWPQITLCLRLQCYGREQQKVSKDNFASKNYLWIWVPIFLGFRKLEF